MKFKKTFFILALFTVFISLSCISAADIHSDNNISDSNLISEQNNSDIGIIDVTDSIPEENNSHISIIDIDPSIIDIDPIIHINPHRHINDTNSVTRNEDNIIMSLRGESGSTGYHWVISPETYGVDLISRNNYLDNPDPRLAGSASTTVFDFHITSDDYYVKLILVTPSGQIAEEIDSNMIN